MTKPESPAPHYRKIIHVDMDCFYAAVEMRDNPSLAGKPVAVAHDAPRGVVTTANYVARKFGIRSAISAALAKKLCSSLIIVPPRFEAYKAESAKIHAIFHEYTDVIEPLSLDEAYLDVTVNKPGIQLAMDIAREIKAKIKQRTGLTASAGVSFCKFLAKIASDWRKPDGLCVIHPDQALDFISKVPIEDFWGVGPATAQRMRKLGITNGEQLRNCSLQMLSHHFGKSGRSLYNFARGIDNRRVEPSRIRKSVSCEQTLTADTASHREIMQLIEEMAPDLQRRVAKNNFVGHTFVLKVKYANFKTHSRSHTYLTQLTEASQFVSAAKALLPSVLPPGQMIRLVGIGVANNQHSADTDSTFQPEIDFGEY